KMVDVKTKLDNAPNDLKLIEQLRDLHDELGKRQEQAKQFAEARASYREAIRLGEALDRTQPLLRKHRESLAETNLSLGKIHVQFKDYESAYACFHRRLDLLEQLNNEKADSKTQTEIAEMFDAFGQLAELSGQTTEAVRWYVRATRAGEAQA